MKSRSSFVGIHNPMILPIILAFAIAAKSTPVVPATNLNLRVSGDIAALSWSGSTGVFYQVEGKTAVDPSSTNWEAIGAPTMSFGLTEIQTSPTKIYRVGIYTNTVQYTLNIAGASNDSVPPTTPSGLSCLATNINQLLMSWQASTDPGPGQKSGVKGYELYRGSVSIPPTNLLRTVSVPATNYWDTNVTAGIIYSYRVRAFDYAGNRSAFSNTNWVATPCSITTSSSPSAGGLTAGGGTKNYGSSVTVVATPNAGYNFLNWTEGGVVISSSSAYTFTANGNRSLVANFTTSTCTYAIGTSSSPSAGGSTAGGGTVNCGSSVTVTATPASCYSFANWTENGTVVSTSASYTFTANGNRNLVANFTQATYSISTSSSPSAGGSTSGGGSKNCGSSVTVTATPASCYSFVNWTENGTVVSTSASYAFTANANRTLVANFSQTTYSVSTSSSPTAGGSTSGGGTKTCGSSVTVTATANSGYTFTNWTENGTVVSTSPSYAFSANANRSLVANYTLATSGGGITNNLVGYWTFDTANVSGTTALDSSGNANHGTLQGTVSIVSGKIAQAVSLDGVSGSVSVPDSATLDITGPFTVSTWVNFASLPGSGKYPNIIAKLSSPSSYYGYGLFWNGSGVSAIIGPGSPGWYLTSSAPAPPAGSWNHYVAVFDGANLKLYVNGAFYSQVAAAAPGDTAGVPVKMGAHYSDPSSYGFINGLLDDARIYNRALSASDVAELYNYSGSGTGCTYAIGTSSSPSAGGSTAGGGTVNCGSSVTVTATPASCYSFANWTENGTVVSTSASYTFTVNGNRNLVANFVTANYTITPSVSTSILPVGGTASSPVTTNCGAQATVTATPYSGYNFAGWTESGTNVYGLTNYSFTVDRNRSLVANFAPVPCTYTVNTSSSPSAGGSTSGGGTTNCGSSVTVTATANSGYTFTNWSENGTAVLNAPASYTFTANTNRTLVANFVAATTNSPGELQWVKTMLCQNGNAIVTGVAADSSGNVVTVGYFNGTVNFGSGPISSTFAQNVTDAFVAKYGPRGTLLWIKQLGSDGSDTAKSVAIDSGDNIIVAGNFQNTVDFGGGAVTASSSSEMFVAKYSPIGAHIWSKHYRGLTSDVGNTVSIDGNDNVIVAADCGYNADFGGILLNPAGGAADIDAALGKLSSATGATIWAKQFGGVNWDFATAVTVDRFGDVVVTGYFLGSVDLGAGPLGNAGSYDIFLAKYSGVDGSYRWGKRFGSSGSDRGNGVTTDPNTGNIVITGLFNGAVDFGGGGIGGSGGIYIAGYDTNGAYLWAKATGASGDSGAAVRIDRSSNLVLTGRASNWIDFGTWPQDPLLIANGQVNFFVASFTIAGNSPPAYRWTKYVGANTDGAGSGNAVALDPTGQVLAGGAFLATIDFGGGPVVAGMAGYNSGFVVKYGN